jgi:NitT/TauT family transport system substrate-binding protein
VARKSAIAAAVGALVLLAAVLAPEPAVAEPFRLGYSTWVGYGPFFVARKKGYFKEEGLDLDLVRIEDVKVRFAALAAGRIDAMATTVDTLPLFLRPRGIKYQYLFAIDGSRGGDGVVANKDIKSVAGLRGRKVAFAEGSASQFYINVLLKEAGLEQSDIEAVDMTAGDAGSAFISGEVDAAVTWEPWLTRGKQAPHGRLLADSSEKPGLITNVVLAPAKAIRDREAEVKALYQGGQCHHGQGTGRLAQEPRGLRRGRQRRGLLRRGDERGLLRNGRGAGRPQQDDTAGARHLVGARQAAGPGEAQGPGELQRRGLAARQGGRSWRKAQ